MEGFEFATLTPEEYQTFVHQNNMEILNNGILLFIAITLFGIVVWQLIKNVFYQI